MQPALITGSNGLIFFSIMGVVVGYLLTQLFFAYTVHRKVRFPGSDAIVEWVVATPALIFSSAMVVLAREGVNNVPLELGLFAMLAVASALFYHGYCRLQHIPFPKPIVPLCAAAIVLYAAALSQLNAYWLRFICVSAFQASMYGAFLVCVSRVMLRAPRRTISHGLWVLAVLALTVGSLTRTLIGLSYGSEFTAVFALKYNDLFRLYMLGLFGNVVVGISIVLAMLEKVLDVTRHAETHDELTGLANRRAVMAQGRREVELALRSGLGLVVALVDIDHFKRINDTLGHDVGDQVLVAVAKGLGAERRQADLVGRYGGEEFLVIFPGEDRAEVLGQRLVEHVRSREHGDMPKVTISVGLAVLPAGAREGNWSNLLHDADQALYAAKRGGRDRAVVYAAPRADAKAGDVAGGLSMASA